MQMSWPCQKHGRITSINEVMVTGLICTINFSCPQDVVVIACWPVPEAPFELGPHMYAAAPLQQFCQLLRLADHQMHGFISATQKSALKAPGPWYRVSLLHQNLAPFLWQACLQQDARLNEQVWAVFIQQAADVSHSIKYTCTVRARFVNIVTIRCAFVAMVHPCPTLQRLAALSVPQDCMDLTNRAAQPSQTP